MRASRLLNMLMLLQVRRRMPAAALAAEFEVSVRTIYRDVDALSAAGVPIYAEQGRNGGIALHEGYRSRLAALTPAEAEALALSGLQGAARDLGIGAEAAAAQMKMLASLPPDSGASAGRLAQRFHLDPLPWYHRAETIECLPTLANAVWREKRIRIIYESWKGEVRRTLDPLGLVQKGGVWYLVAAAQKSIRAYRASGIRGLDVSDVCFRRPLRFDLPRFWSNWVCDFEARLMRDRASVRISEEGMRILRAVAPAAAEIATATVRPDATPGWKVAELPIESIDYSARQLLRLGVEVEVLAPAALRKAVADEATLVAAIHVEPVRNNEGRTSRARRRPPRAI